MAHSRAVDLILAGVYTILVNTKGKKGARSLSVFVVENEIEGFRVGLLSEKDGLKILPTGKLIYENCLIPKENLVGDEGKSLLLALDAIDKGRILLAGMSCGLACRKIILTSFYKFDMGFAN